MRRIYILLLMLVGAVVVVTVAPMLGIKTISIMDALRGRASSEESSILWTFRIPRVGLSGLAGAALAVSGMAFQAMFRNPLAEPFTLGVSSGASLGAALYISFGLAAGSLGVTGVTFAAFIGAVVSVALVYGLTFARSGFSTGKMLLAGVAVSFFFASVNMLLQYVSDLTESHRILMWTMASLETVGFGPLLNILPFTLAGTAVVLVMYREMNLLTAGDDIAASRGLNVRRTKNVLFLATSLMIGAITSVCGPIAFVGMMSPHICRMIIGPDHRYLGPASVLFGGAFLTLCDALGRMVLAPAEIPVGIITAMLGGPFFLWLLLSDSSRARL